MEENANVKYIIATISTKFMRFSNQIKRNEFKFIGNFARIIATLAE